MNKAVWITWENQRRNKTLSNALSVKLFQLEANTHRMLRYPILIFRTMKVLVANRPDIIISQNPSIVLALFSCIYGLILRKKIVIDAHNAGVYPFEGNSAWANLITRFIFRHAYLTIVTNETLKQYVESQGGKAFVLPDPFPEIDTTKSKPLRGCLNFLLICTWAADEPYEQVIQAFASLDADYVLYVTGNSKGKANELSCQIPENVILTGYVSDMEFDTLLNSCDCILDLTTREDCLVCGAYEAVAAGKPLVLSDTRALRSYFKNSAVYTSNTNEAIVDAVTYVACNLDKVSKQVVEYRERQKVRWNMVKDRLVFDLELTEH